MKKNLALILVCVLVLATLSGCDKKEKVVMRNAHEMVSLIKCGWNAGNTLDSTDPSFVGRTVAGFETGWGNPQLIPNVVERVKETGFDAVRVPVTWNYHYKLGIIDEEWMARVEEIVNMVLDNDMICIINMHHDTGANYSWIRADKDNYEKNKEIVAELWTQIAEHFKDYPDTLMFEGFNEMLDVNNEWNEPDESSLEAMNMWNQLFVDTVRKTGGNNKNRNLICNTYAAACTKTVLDGFKMPKDSVEDHLIAEIHSYAPWGFTSTSATWTTMTDVFTKDQEKEVDAVMDSLNEYFVKNDIPVIIGEYGSENKGNVDERIRWAQYVVGNARKIGVPCFYWDEGSSMGIIGRYMAPTKYQAIADAIVEAAKGE